MNTMISHRCHVIAELMFLFLRSNVAVSLHRCQCVLDLQDIASFWNQSNPKWTGVEN